MSELANYDVLVIGCGAAGHGAALAAAEAGKRVAVVESDPGIGSGSTRRRAIPLRVLQHRAVELIRAARVTRIDRAVDISSLEPQANKLVEEHTAQLKTEMARKFIDLFHARASFLSERVVQLTTVHGARQRITANLIVIATGTRQLATDAIAADHEHILDPESILSMRDLPRTLLVTGSGVVAVQFASIFTHLGVRVTMVDTAAKPLPFLDPEIVDRFLKSFVKAGGRYLGDTEVSRVRWNGATQVETVLNQGGMRLESDRVLLTGRTEPCIAGLGLDRAGLSLTSKQALRIDRNGCTTLPHIWAAGGVVGSNGLASHSFRDGRRVMRGALGLKQAEDELAPIGIHGIPEIASVGLTEDEAARKKLVVAVGRADLDNLTWTRVTEAGSGLLKLVAESKTGRLLGTHAVGPDAADLVQLGQVAIAGRLTIDDLAKMTYGFPVRSEAYRAAALDLQRKTRLDQTLSLV